MDTEYVFHLVLKTSAGTFSSEKLKVQTHKMTDLSGITITPGHMPAALRESLQKTVERIGAKMVDTVRIDTTHFVCTEGRGPAWEKAVENNIPVVVPDWVKGCERDGRIVGVRGYYLNADPRLRQIGPGGASPQVPQQQQPGTTPLTSPRTEVTPPTPERPTHAKEPEDAAPPPPPPKDEDSDKSEAEAWPGHKSEPKAQVEEQKARAEDLKPSVDADESEDDDSEEEEKTSTAKAVEASLPTRRATVKDEKEDEATFDDVTL